MAAFGYEASVHITRPPIPRKQLFRLAEKLQDKRSEKINVLSVFQFLSSISQISKLVCLEYFISL